MKTGAIADVHAPSRFGGKTSTVTRSALTRHSIARLTSYFAALVIGDAFSSSSHRSPSSRAAAISLGSHLLAARFGFSAFASAVVGVISFVSVGASTIGLIPGGPNCIAVRGRGIGAFGTREGVEGERGVHGDYGRGGRGVIDSDNGSDAANGLDGAVGDDGDRGVNGDAGFGLFVDGNATIQYLAGSLTQTGDTFNGYTATGLYDDGTPFNWTYQLGFTGTINFVAVPEPTTLAALALMTPMLRRRCR